MIPRAEETPAIVAARSTFNTWLRDGLTVKTSECNLEAQNVKQKNKNIRPQTTLLYEGFSCCTDEGVSFTVEGPLSHFLCGSSFIRPAWR